MEIILTLLNSSLQSIKVVDDFISLLWVDRYDELGDFELFVDSTIDNLAFFQKDYYLTLEGSDHSMIIESVEIKSDIESGDTLCIKGRSLESILYRRVVWAQTLLSGNLQTEIQRVLNENVISPVVVARDIPNLIFISSVDPVITALSIEGQIGIGKYLYEVVSELCKMTNLGFKISLTTAGNFEFSLYSGKDRSYTQVINPYVVFSPSFDNLLGSNYFTSNSELKTIALVAGEGEGSARLTTTVNAPSGSGTGLNRRELFVDARDLSKTTSSGTLSDPVYLNQLSQRGNTYLAINSFANMFEGEIDSNVMYEFGTDFFMGDIVQLENQYNQGGRSRITEVIRSQSSSGISIHPSFTSLD
jgi:hypothetical protein